LPGRLFAVGNQISVLSCTLIENPATAAAEAARQAPPGKLQTLGLSALGIVFGDIGTSPLYTFKTVLGTTEGSPDAGVILGALSLVLWTLFIITTVKYVSFAMRVDNDGEGGILGMMRCIGYRTLQRTSVQIEKLGLIDRAP
jgi:KUP system potassium uptake protein